MDDSYTKISGLTYSVLLNKRKSEVVGTWESGAYLIITHFQRHCLCRCCIYIYGIQRVLFYWLFPPLSVSNVHPLVSNGRPWRVSITPGAVLRFLRLVLRGGRSPQRRVQPPYRRTLLGDPETRCLDAYERLYPSYDI